MDDDGRFYVIGVPSEQWGEEVKAVVRLLPGVSLTEAAIGSVMAPKSVDAADELPRAPIGETDKEALRDPYWVAAGRQILIRLSTRRLESG